MKWLKSIYGGLRYLFNKEYRNDCDYKRGYDYALSELHNGTSKGTLLNQADSIDKTNFDYGIRDCVLNHNNVTFGELV